MNIPSSVKALLVSGLMSTVLASSAFAQSANNDEAIYHALLQAISAEKITLAQQQMYVARQVGEIATLNAQLTSLDDVKAGVEPMLGKMTTGISGQINSDYPFELDRRIPRLQALQNTMKDPAVSVGDKYRKALNVYKLEVNYGQSMEAKKGNHPIPEKRTIRVGDDRYEKDDEGKFKLDKNKQKIEIFDGSYLRYGRLAYVYIQADSSSAMRYDLETKSWVDLPKNSFADMRRAVRVASGEAAPSVVKVPILGAP